MGRDWMAVPTERYRALQRCRYRATVAVATEPVPSSCQGSPPPDWGRTAQQEYAPPPRAHRSAWAYESNVARGYHRSTSASALSGSSAEHGTSIGFIHGRI